jgi:photosystem II stability/assembly factor-like uncharacterized protein
MKVIRLAVLVVFSAMAAAQSPLPRGPVWRMEESGTTAGMRGIDSVDGAVAWASGTGGTVLRTIDDGEHWTRCATPAAGTDGGTLDFRGVQAWDAQTAIVMASGPGEKSRLYKTVDGCRTWKLLFKNPDSPDGFFDSLHLMVEQRSIRDDEGFGLLLGDSVHGELSVFETRNGGHTWTRIHDPLLKLDGGAFAASNQCIAGINATDDFVISGKAVNQELRLNYTGHYWLNDGSLLRRTWNKVSIPLTSGNDSAGVFAIASKVRIAYGKSENEVVGLELYEVAVGGDYQKPDSVSNTSAFTADSGKTWTASTTPPHGYRSAVQWSESLKAWITVGMNGSDISRDDGKTWQALDDGNWNALSLPFVVGPNGRIARLNAAALPAGKP